MPTRTGPRSGQNVGNYQLSSLLGQGGFADVYLGTHRYLGTQAAVKVLHVSAEQAIQDLIAQEARTSARLDHPHINRLLECGFEHATPYLVMHYAPGGNLRSLHPRGSLVAFERVMFYVRQIAEALQYAHDARIVHRDVKPENLLLGPHNELWLSDFGLAIAAHESHSMSEQELAGTALYMAPEQSNGQAVPASDQYALAVVIYEWIAGRPPFQGRSPIEIALKHREAAPPALPTQHTSGMTNEARGLTDTILKKALAKEPHQRFESVLAFAQALEEVSRDCKLARGSTISLYQHTGRVHALAWSPQGRFLASAGSDATVQVWETTTNRLHQTYLGHTQYITALAWSPNEEALASAGGDTDIHIWHPRTGKRLLSYQGHTHSIGVLSWSPTGWLLASAARKENTVQVWEIETGNLLQTYREHHTGEENTPGVRALAWSPDGVHLASASEKHIHLWNAPTGQRLSTFTDHAPDEGRSIVTGLAFSPNGYSLASASSNGTVQVWEIETGNLLQTYRGHPIAATCVAWSPDGRLLASGSYDRTVQIWVPFTERCILTYREHSDVISALAWSPDGRTIASAGADGRVCLWQV